MAALLVARRRAQQQFRRERVFRDRNNPIDSFNDDKLIQRYRLPRYSILTLVDKLNALERPTHRSQALPVTIQVLVTLRFYAKGTFLSETADIHGISKSAASECITAVTDEINKSAKYIVFPSTPRELLDTKTSFYQVAQFPNVIGVVDGSLIPIRAPSEDEPAYVCRKGYHAINIQAVVDAKMRFTNVVSRWPGSVHDAFVWSNCTLATHLERGQIDGWLLGDSGYALRPWLLTPLHNPVTRQQRAYNKAFKITRCIVEMAFGVLKSRFRCLHKSGGCLQFSPPKNCKVILATCHLHNLCIEQGIPLPVDEQPDDEDPDEDGDEAIYTGPLNDGKEVQNRLIETRFNHW